MNGTRSLPAPTAERVATHTTGRSAVLHLAPGAAAMAVYIAAAPLVRHIGLPSIAALALSGLLGVAPVQLVLLARNRGRHPSSPTNMLRTKLPAARVLGWALVEVVLGAAAFALTGPLAKVLRSSAFGWWPAGWILDPGTHPGFSHRALLVAGLVMLLGSVLVAPVVEEYYFRGYLLPRMPARLGRGAPLAHTVLFAGYHLWTPWLGPTRVLAILPLAYIAVRTRDVRIGIVTHVALNAVDVALLTRYLLT